MSPAVESRWGVTGPYEQLSVLLAEILRTGDDAFDVGKRSVLRSPRRTNTGDDPVGVVVDEMERRGFEPVIRNTRASCRCGATELPV